MDIWIKIRSGIILETFYIGLYMINLDKEETASELRGSLLEFTKFFFNYVTGRDFIVSNPIGRESHHITICRELTRVFRLEVESQRLNINVQPGSHKSTLLCMFVAWSWAHYPDCNFLYISYAHELAAKQTAFIKTIVQSRMYGYLFDVELKADSRAKDHFETTRGGAVKAFGSAGGITGQNAGLPSLDRFSGAVLLDDCLKPKDAHSDTIRRGVIENYRETIVPRPRGINVPILSIAQRVHEDDLCAFFTSGDDIVEWDNIILKAVDDAGNVLHPEVTTKKYLNALQDKSPYLYSSQYQQNPIPAGGALFKPEGFVMLDEEPDIKATFITADTAETNKSYNDATVFSFWGVYEIESMGRLTGELGLHWLDCIELRIEPKHLKDAFLDFWQECMTHPVTPRLAVIEKKSTGVTLTSVLSDIRTLSVRGIERTKASGSKSNRFIELQPLIAGKLISFTTNARHIKMCVEHMSKITANDTHKHDDICFIAGTKIATTRGTINIENIQVNDKIITPLGIGRVSSCGATGFYNVIDNIGLEGTAKHPIFTGKSFEHLDTVCDNNSLDYLTFYGLLQWRYKKLLCSMALNIGLWDRSVITLVSQQAMKDEKILKDCMLRFGSFIQKKQFKKGMLFIIKTMIILITTLKTWNVYRAHNILKTIKKIACVGIIAKKAKNILNSFKKKLKNGMEALKVVSGISSMQKPALISYDKLSVQFAAMNLKSDRQQHDTAQNPVSISNMPKEQEKNEHKKEVFNLTVEHYGVYYANGILVSNCDTAYDACKIGLIDKTIYSINKKDDNRAEVLRNISESYKRKLAAGAARNG